MTSPKRSSRIPGLYKLAPEERLRRVQEFAGLSEEDLAVLRGGDPRALARADKMIENVAGLFHLPVGIAANFRIDGADRIVPMVIEEPSVVAASSNAARLLRSQEGIVTDASPPVMIGQIQLCDVPDVEAARVALEEAADRLVEHADEGHPRHVARGGGARDLRVRTFPDTAIGPMVVVHLLVDVRDAMGANLVNAMAEAVAPECERLSGGRAYLRILSNLADERLVQAEGRVPLERLARPDLGYGGAEVADRIVRASVFAEVDPYRAATHNKGIMNGVDAFLLATGQDWRAVEAGAHAWAARGGRYTAMATWRREDDALVGRITLPMQVGIVGGVVKVHPAVKVLLRVLGAERADDVGRVAAAVGLAQNLAAILALATEGIQRGHMSLHARNIAAAAGATGREIDHIVAEMIRRRTITHAAAESILRESQEEAAADQGAPLTRGELLSIRDRAWPRIEALLAEIVDRDAREGSLDHMIWYQMDTGGKRLRALIPLMVYRAFGGEPDEAVPLAAALELLHNATLIHEDAEGRIRQRRGQDTLWVRFGLDQAINCGDGMHYVALRCLGQLSHPPERVRELERMLVERMTRVIEAQVAARRRDGALDRCLEITRDRTGGLFALAIAGAAALTGAEARLVDRLETIGGLLGVVFQIQDELLDLTGGKPGAPRGRDIVDGKVGLLVAHCLQHADEPDREALRAILRKAGRDTGPDDVARALQLLESQGSLQWAGDVLQDHQERVDRLAEELDHPAAARLVAGIGDLFLAPLLARVQTILSDDAGV
ncbi:MAG: hydroxymethylglutaryl-CoA reductase, degradative [Myxococcota bacterium]